jgi:TolB protein
MKLKCLILLGLIIVSFNTSLYANDSLTVVAVGDAEIERETLNLLKPVVSFKATPRVFQEIKEISSIIDSDFKFYKHRFEVVEKKLNKASFIVQLTYKDFRQVSIDFTHATDSKRSSSFTFSIDNKNIITTAHRISDKIFEAITSEKSIFTSKIVFVSDRTTRGKDLKKELYIMDFDGRRKQRLTYTNSLIISPSLSPDNSKILYSAIEGKWKRSSSGKIHKVKNLNLYLMDLRTKKATVISELDGMNSGAVFSADGKDIYLTLSFGKNADIYKINLATKKRTKITKHFLDDVDPHINRDGTLMTFLSGRSGKAMIYTLDPTGVEKDLKRISYVGKFNAAPRFSPDGSEIVFSSWVDNLFDLYKIDANGQNLVRLTKGSGSNEEPSFSPDGQFIVFTSQKVLSRKSAVQNIYIMNREGEILKNLTENYGKSFTPRWSN